MVQHYTKKDKARIVADAIAISHFIVANVFMILGCFKFFGDVLNKFMGNFSTSPGVDFVFQVMDSPVYGIFGGYAETFRATNPRFFWLGAEFIVILSSAFYGLIAYFLLSLVLKLGD